MLKNGILQAGSVTNNQHQACQFLHGKQKKKFDNGTAHISAY
jgi:hypothetical protein